MFSYIPRTQYLLGPSTYVGSRHFWGAQNFEFQYFFGFSENEYFFGFDDFVDIFGGSSQNWAILSGHFYAFLGLFFMSRHRMEDNFLGC